MRKYVAGVLYLAAFGGVFLGVGIGLQVSDTAAFVVWGVSVALAIAASILIWRESTRRR